MSLPESYSQFKFKTKKMHHGLEVFDGNREKNPPEISSPFL